jgi:hypothetical protein
MFSYVKQDQKTIICPVPAIFDHWNTKPFRYLDPNYVIGKLGHSQIVIDCMFVRIKLFGPVFIQQGYFFYFKIYSICAI